jgi:hypothetical protein
MSLRKPVIPCPETQQCSHHLGFALVRVGLDEVKLAQPNLLYVWNIPYE